MRAGRMPVARATRCMCQRDRPSDFGWRECDRYARPDDDVQNPSAAERDEQVAPPSALGSGFDTAAGSNEADDERRGSRRAPSTTVWPTANPNGGAHTRACRDRPSRPRPAPRSPSGDRRQGRAGKPSVDGGRGQRKERHPKVHYSTSCISAVHVPVHSALPSVFSKIPPWRACSSSKTARTSRISSRITSSAPATTVDHLRSGDDGLRSARARSPPDLVVLDVMLPGMDGMQVCQALRPSRRRRRMPILMLTARGEEADRVRGLELGADDYVTKPFSPKELVARVGALLRRSGSIAAGRPNAAANTDRSRSISIGMRCVLNGEDVRLTAKEFLLLQYLLEHRGRVLSRDLLLTDVWGYQYTGGTRTVDVHVRRLREKMPLARPRRSRPSSSSATSWTIRVRSRDLPHAHLPRRLHRGHAGARRLDASGRALAARVPARRHRDEPARAGATDGAAARGSASCWRSGRRGRRVRAARSARASRSSRADGVVLGDSEVERGGSADARESRHARGSRRSAAATGEGTAARTQPHHRRRHDVRRGLGDATDQWRTSGWPCRSRRSTSAWRACDDSRWSACGAGLAVALVLTWIASAFLSRRIRIVADTAAAIQRGDFSRPARDHGHDEIGTVANVLDDTARELGAGSRTWRASARTWTRS